MTRDLLRGCLCFIPVYGRAPEAIASSIDCHARSVRKGSLRHPHSAAYLNLARDKNIPQSVCEASKEGNQLHKSRTWTLSHKAKSERTQLERLLWGGGLYSSKSGQEKGKGPGRPCKSQFSPGLWLCGRP